MKITYVSPSKIPSTTANSVHVLRQCEAIEGLGHNITLYCSSSTERSDLKRVISLEYGIDASKWKVVCHQEKDERARVFLVALKALTFKRDQYVISRNLYYSFMMTLLRRAHVYETHQVEYGWRSILQSRILSEKMVRTIVISKALRRDLEIVYKLKASRIHVMADAATNRDIRMYNREEKEKGREGWEELKGLKRSWLVGYVGSLGAGRGIDIIEEMAAINRDMMFVLAGDTNSVDQSRRERMSKANCVFLGHVSHARTLELMRLMDTLIMPYQEKTLLCNGLDTTRWMSPMKAFEYMSSGVPIVSSDIKVLGEILHCGKNCLKVEPKDVLGWTKALETLRADNRLCEAIAEESIRLVREKYNWNRRAEDILEILKG